MRRFRRWIIPGLGYLTLAYSVTFWLLRECGIDPLPKPASAGLHGPGSGDIDALLAAYGLDKDATLGLIMIALLATFPFTYPLIDRLHRWVSGE